MNGFGERKLERMSDAANELLMRCVDLQDEDV